ncbi:MAG TPA: hypothetical protein PLV06_03390 [Bacteroidales bacterium]|nr:hypothetical protein [Bacteroidales bacterium]HPR11406.1 hypothetical protein [Bacteroidales bacterium]HRW85278.1 hypothetical protein [Bacteroidales bacterium]
MKKFRTIIMITTLIITAFGCEELPDPAGTRGLGVVPVVSEPNPGIYINGSASSYISFEVDYLSGTSADKTEVVVSHGKNFERVKLEELTTFPATITYTLGEAVDAIGIPLSSVLAGDVIYFEVVTTVDGVITRSNAAQAIPVVCNYDPALAAGNYHAVSADWQVDGAVTITVDPVDQYKVYVAGLSELDGLTEDLGPLVMHISPATLKVTADRTVLASDAFGYHNFAYEGSGTFNSCNGKYTMSFIISVDEGSWGANAFTLTRQ